MRTRGLGGCEVMSPMRQSARQRRSLAQTAFALLPMQRLRSASAMLASPLVAVRTLPACKWTGHSGKRVEQSCTPTAAHDELAQNMLALGNGKLEFEGQSSQLPASRASGSRNDVQPQLCARLSLASAP